MNQQVKAPDLRPHADAVRPRAWRADELERMLAAGIITERDRIELIGGEVIAMASKGARHEVLGNELIVYWADRRPKTIKFAEEAPLRLSDHDEPEPDIILFPATQRVTEVTGATILLVVEVADSSLGYDLKIKAPLYASFSVAEYWVVNARSLVTTVHRDPGPDGYRDVRAVDPHVPVAPLAAPELAVQIAELGLAPIT